MLELQKLRSELAALKSSFNEAIMHGNSIEQIRNVYVQIKSLQQNIREKRLAFMNVAKNNDAHSGLSI